MNLLKIKEESQGTMFEKYISKIIESNKIGSNSINIDCPHNVGVYLHNKGFNVRRIFDNLNLDYYYNITWEDTKRCKCGKVPIYRNRDLQLCSKCLGAIWIGRITLDEYLQRYK